MNRKILFDMDGTIADLYGVKGWNEMLRNADPTPYIEAKPLLNLSLLARLIHKAQSCGHKVIVVSWLAMDSTHEYDRAVTEAKLNWLAKHLPSVDFDKIAITPYGISKSNYADEESILFDDNKKIRENFIGKSFEPSDIFEILKNLM